MISFIAHSQKDLDSLKSIYCDECFFRYCDVLQNGVF